jgi:hypothetical protein
LSLIAGCSIGQQTAAEFLEEKNATNQVVTYYANGGYFGTDREQKTLYYKADTPVVSDFAATGAKIQLTRKGYVFDSWYYAETDASGNPVLDENGNLKITDKKVDFTKNIQENEHWYLVAGWFADVQVDVVVVTSDGGDITSSDGETVYKNKEIATSKQFGTNGTIVLSTTEPVKTNDGYTFVQYFYDEALTKPANGTITKPEEADAESIVVYAQYIAGDWTIVRTASDANKMLSALSRGGSYYFASASDDKTIDMSSYKQIFRYGEECSITIEGNGFTLSNLTYEGTGLNGTEYSIFGRMTENTVIKNLTLKDVTLNATLKSTIGKMYALSSSVTGATLTNFKVDGITLNITTKSSNGIENIDTASGATNSSWLFGGYETDALFLEAYTDVTVENSTLNIKLS